MEINDYNLTNDAKFLIASMYKEYLDRRMAGMEKRQARSFDGVAEINSKIMPQWNEADVLDTCLELRDKGLITGSPANMTLVYINMTTDSVAALEVSFKDKLDKVILYGSYARGDYNEHSDVDIMILTTLTDEEIEEAETEIFDLAFDFQMDYDIDISVVIQNKERFNYWLGALPFYNNVQKEGIVLNG